MRRIILSVALLLTVAGIPCRASAPPKVEINFLPCSLKEHLIQADWWSCTARPNLPVLVYGAYETRVPVFAAHAYLSMPRDFAPPSVKWSDARGFISFSAQELFDGPAGAVAAPGYQILMPSRDANHIERSGKTVLIAQLTGSIKQTLRVPAVVYRTLSVGCYAFARAPGLLFTANDGSAIAATPANSDLYVTGPAANAAGAIPGPGYGCSPPFADASGDFVLHFPAGGTMLKTTRFDQLGSAAWKNEMSSISLQDIKNNAFIFKTRRGATVKVLILENAPGRIGGVYETANSHGVFSY